MLPESVSVTKRVLQIVSAVIFCLTCAGVVFGYAALKPVLIAEGAYKFKCTKEELEAGGWVCKDQDTALNFMFALSTVATNVAALPIGIMLDKKGPKITSILGAVFFLAGNIVFGLKTVTPYFDSYVIGYFLLALGGPLIFLPSFHLANAFPSYSGLILSAITGAFDASSMPFLVYQIIYKKVLGGINMRYFFWGYTILPVLIIIEQLLLAPSEVYARPTAASATLDAESHHDEEDISSSFSRVSYNVEARSNPEFKKALKEKDPLTGKLFGESAVKQICSSWWVLIFAFLVVHMTRINFYIQTSFSQLLFFTHNRELSETLVTTFTILLPAGGIIGVPIIGLLLDKRSSFDAALVVAVVGALYGGLAMLPSTGAQVTAIVCFAFLRPLMYTYVSDFNMKVFGPQNFGTVYGLANSGSGLFGLILAPLDILVKGPLNGDYSPINIVLAFAGVIISLGIAVRIYLGTRTGGIQLD